MDAYASSALLAFLGFLVGTLSGFFGVGGAFLMTPALNILGFPMIYAIGTDLALMIGSSTVGALRHFHFGNVDMRLGLYMVIGTAVGVWLGKELVFLLAAAGEADLVLRAIYMVLLFGLAVFMIHDYFAFVRRAGHPRRHHQEQVGTRLSRWLHGVKLWPLIDLPTSGLKRVSVWLPVGVGTATGFLAALLGVGGGFIRMPALIYGMGVPTTVAVGTDLFEIIFSSSVGAWLYAMEGKVHLPAAMVMLVGATLGVQAGSYATQHVRGMRVRLYFALTIFGAGVSVVLKQLSVWWQNPLLAIVAAVLILAVATIMMLVIVTRLIVGLQDQAAASSRSARVP